MLSTEPNPIVGTTERPRGRVCGACSLCCTVLRVDEIAKLGGTRCAHQRERAATSATGDAEGCCGIHATRPPICRAYRCLWLQGRLDDGDRPDRLGAVLDLVPTGGAVRLSIREAAPGAFERSARLREIAEQFRELMPVRITDVADVLDPDRPFRVLLGGGEEQRVAGDLIVRLRDGVEIERRRTPWPERWVRRAAMRWQAWKLRRIGAR